MEMGPVKNGAIEKDGHVAKGKPPQTLNIQGAAPKMAGVELLFNAFSWMCIAGTFEHVNEIFSERNEGTKNKAASF